MVKSIVGVIAGYAVWTVIWLGGNGLLFPDAAEVVGKGELYDKTGPLLAVIGLSLVCSLAAGLTAAAISRNPTAVIVTGGLLLATGVFVQSTVWNLMPVWYHLTFLVLIVPVVFCGQILTDNVRTRRAQVGEQKVVSV